MILGVDHLALSCENIDQGAKLLAALGYRPKFIQKDVPNPVAKRHLLRTYGALHSLAYCHPGEHVALELTQHSGQLRPLLSPYQVLFQGPPGDALPWPGDLPPSWESAWRLGLNCLRPEPLKWPSLQAQFWFDAGRDNPAPGSVRALLVPVHNLSRSEMFWTRGLGCRALQKGETEQGEGWLHLAFQAPVPAWRLDLVLVESDAARPPAFLDDPGFPCLALISSSLARDQDAAGEMGAREISDEFLKG
ncbi:MAG: hypothetical protein HY743_10355 [Deltaproteobacteria bacterium]|nr:hypothetical protein [Deltaproteobacteria bacterium]